MLAAGFGGAGWVGAVTCTGVSCAGGQIIYLCASCRLCSGVLCHSGCQLPLAVMEGRWKKAALHMCQLCWHARSGSMSDPLAGCTAMHYLLPPRQPVADGFHGGQMAPGSSAHV